MVLSIQFYTDYPSLSRKSYIPQAFCQSGMLPTLMTVLLVGKVICPAAVRKFVGNETRDWLGFRSAHSNAFGRKIPSRDDDIPYLKGLSKVAWRSMGTISNKTKLFTQNLSVIQAFEVDFCVINCVQLLTSGFCIAKIDRADRDFFAISDEKLPGCLDLVRCQVRITELKA
jgi:hypothetical protein